MNRMLIVCLLRRIFLSLVDQKTLEWKRKINFEILLGVAI